LKFEKKKKREAGGFLLFGKKKKNSGSDFRSLQQAQHTHESKKNKWFVSFFTSRSMILTDESSSITIPEEELYYY